MTHLEKLVKSQIAAIYASLVGTQKYSAETTKSHITLWHSDFDESGMCFVIEVEAYCEKKASFSAYLYPHDKNRKAKCLKVLQEVLEVGGESFDEETQEDKEWYIMLPEYEEVDIDESLAEKFAVYFDKVKDRVYHFNQKIQADLLSQAGSKLEEFIA